MDFRIRGMDCVEECAILRREVDPIAEVAFAGSAYAAYGGIIAASPSWLWLVERQWPTVPDVLGGALAISSALVIIGFARSR